jgi:hypothetical protein
VSQRCFGGTNFRTPSGMRIRYSLFNALLNDCNFCHVATVSHAVVRGQRTNYPATRNLLELIAAQSTTARPHQSENETREWRGGRTAMQKNFSLHPNRRNFENRIFAPMSAFGGKADIAAVSLNVGY